VAVSWLPPTETPRDADWLVADPHYEWALSTDFRYYGDAQWLPVLIELTAEPGNTAERFANEVIDFLKNNGRGPAWAAHVRVPSFYTQPPKRLKGSLRFISVLMCRELLRDIYRGKAPASRIRRFEVGRATPTADLLKPATVTASAITAFVGKPKVVVGVIDDGIALAHDRLCDAVGGTRIEYLWDQQVPSTAWFDLTYGREFTKAGPNNGIDPLMNASRYGPLVDEDEVYRRCGMADQSKPGHKPLAARASHGAHVADVACQVAVPPAAGERPVLAVQLPVKTVEEMSWTTLSPQIFNGLLYMVHKVAAIGGAQVPLVVNISYGMIAGPHDGSHLLEAGIDFLVSAFPGLHVVLPAGNNHLSRCHAHFSVARNRTATLHWRVLPDDRTGSYLEIWMPSDGGASPALEVTVTTPTGASSTPFTTGQTQYVAGNLVTAQASYYPPSAAHPLGKYALMRLSIAPTGDPDGLAALAPAGLWRIDLKNTGRKAVKDVHAWIQRDDGAPGYPRRGRQSHFDDLRYLRYDVGGRPIEQEPAAVESYVRRRTTLNAIATGSKTLVIAGCRRSDGAMSRDSGSGPAIPPGRANGYSKGPDATLLGDVSPSHRGVLGAGTRSGSCVTMFGTSVAAPAAAALIADRIVAGTWGPTVTRNQLFNFAKNEDPLAFPSPRPASDRAGGGRIAREVQRKPRIEHP
jgi:subtilisin family serine protease